MLSNAEVGGVETIARGLRAIDGKCADLVPGKLRRLLVQIDAGPAGCSRSDGAAVLHHIREIEVRALHHTGCDRRDALYYQIRLRLVRDVKGDGSRVVGFVALGN